MARDDDDRVEPLLPLHAGRVGSDTPITDQLIYLLRHRPRVIPYLARVLRNATESAPSSQPSGPRQEGLAADASPAGSVPGHPPRPR